MPDSPVYKRVLLKISGEGFCRPDSGGIEGDEVDRIAREIIDVSNRGVRLAIVVGGGNLIRGKTFASGSRVQRATADYMGMLATVMNALALQDTLESMGQPTRVQSAIEMRAVCEPYIRRRADRHLDKGRVVILAAGTGNPFVTTDTAAALRATELGVDALLKATKVDGVYSSDPNADKSAKFIDRLTHGQVLSSQLGVMDLAAISLCMEHKIPVVVFNLKKHGNIARVVCGEKIGTVITAS
ncbi:MAG: Uridylate kinase [Phycisphaerae bacterium]|nr:Uridylate kinase [Phycisphaerae bacterium]